MSVSPLSARHRIFVWVLKKLTDYGPPEHGNFFPCISWTSSTFFRHTFNLWIRTYCLLCSAGFGIYEIPEVVRQHFRFAIAIGLIQCLFLNLITIGSSLKIGMKKDVHHKRCNVHGSQHKQAFYPLTVYSTFSNIRANVD